jgi:2-succinyl-5-enolpyruvyl-6-hydroxy-3-cyclohexene-1-carboxylate synthase
VLAEASSHLKPLLGEQLLGAGEPVAQRGLDDHLFDSVIRLGDVPSWRLWRDLETRGIPVASASRLPFRGMTLGVHVQVPAGAPLSAILPDVAPFPPSAARAIAALDLEARKRVAVLLESFPRSEPAVVRAVSRAVPPGSFVYLGNSLPIREWNQFADAADPQLLFGENRGANGIDGQLSTFFGWADDGRENWALVGDLTALYDVASPWAVRHVRGLVRLVVVNNGGGMIFERLFANPRFQNRHGLTFEAFAQMWGLDYHRELGPLADRPALVELQPDPLETRAFWRAWNEVFGG